MRKRIITASVIAGTLLLNGNAQAATNAELEQRIKELEQQVNLLTRKQEVTEEVYTADKAKAATTGTVKAGPDGFSISSADKTAELKFKLESQFDGRFYRDDQQAKDTWLVRTLRPTIEGKIGDVAWRVTPELANDSANLVDGYVDWTLPTKDFTGPDPVVFRGGQFKGPVGLERLQSNTALMFLERAFPTELVPNRDRGVALYSNVLDKRLSLELAATNGTADGRDATTTDFDGEPEFNARVFFEPVPGIGFGVAGTHGTKDSANDLRAASSTNNQAFLPRYRSPAQNTIFQYGSDAVADGDHDRFTPQAYAYVGPFGAMAEYVESQQQVGLKGVSDNITNKAAQVSAVWAITGEDETYKSILKPANDRYGAWEVALRWSTLEIDDNAFDLGFADITKSVKEADEWAVGVNWLVTQNLKFMTNYTDTTFDGGAKGGDRPDEKVVSARMQLAY
jgi:phosphate-selective porin OprO/OprP